MAETGPGDGQPERQEPPEERGYRPSVRRRAALSGLAQERITAAPARSGTNRLSGAPRPQPNRRPLLIAGVAVGLVVALGVGVFAFLLLHNASSPAPAGGRPPYHLNDNHLATPA